jgi:hypothetical protein
LAGTGQNLIGSQSIEYWGGERRSTVELPFYPLQYYQGPSRSLEDGILSNDSIDELKLRLINRGRKYQNFCIAEKGKQMFNYDGIAHFQKSGESCGKFPARATKEIIGLTRSPLHRPLLKSRYRLEMEAAESRYDMP